MKEYLKPTTNFRTLQQRERNYFFNKMYGVGTLKEISQAFKKDYAEVKNSKKDYDKVVSLYGQYYFAITFLYSAHNIKTNLSLFRNIIKKEGGIWEETALKSFTIPFLSNALIEKKTDEETKTVEINIENIKASLKELTHKTTSKSIKEINKILDKKEFSELVKQEQTTAEAKEDEVITSSDLNFKATVKQLKEIVSLTDREFKGVAKVKANQDINQVRAYYLSLLVGLTGGRRFSEDMAKSSIVKKSGEYYHDGILKKKGHDNLVKCNILDLTVTEYKKYQKQLQKFTQDRIETAKGKTLKTVSIDEINSIFARVFNNAVKRISANYFNMEIPKVHALRHLYAIEQQKRHIEDNPHLLDLSQSELYSYMVSFRRDILGHEEKPDSSKTYNEFLDKYSKR